MASLARKLAEHSAAELGGAQQAGLLGDETPGPKRHPWAWLLKKVLRFRIARAQAGVRLGVEQAKEFRGDSAGGAL